MQISRTQVIDLSATGKATYTYCTNTNCTLSPVFVQIRGWNLQVNVLLSTGRLQVHTRLCTSAQRQCIRIWIRILLFAKCIYTYKEYIYKYIYTYREYIYKGIYTYEESFFVVAVCVVKARRVKETLRRYKTENKIRYAVEVNVRKCVVVVSVRCRADNVCTAFRRACWWCSMMFAMGGLPAMHPLPWTVVRVKCAHFFLLVRQEASPVLGLPPAS